LAVVDLTPASNFGVWWILFQPVIGIGSILLVNVLIEILYQLAEALVALGAWAEAL
jgi:hypothetical protein